MCCCRTNVKETGHIILYEEVKILDSEINLHKRLFLDIRIDTNKLNIKKDKEQVSYTYLIKYYNDKVLKFGANKKVVNTNANFFS